MQSRKLAAVGAASMLVLAASVYSEGSSRPPTIYLGDAIDGPYARLLAASEDLGPSHRDEARVTAALSATGSPTELSNWAAAHRLSVRWQPGEDWAYIAGPPADIANAFGVEVHDYRSPDGQLFYGSPQQPQVPAAVRDSVSGLGRILNYNQRRQLDRLPLPQKKGEAPPGLSPSQIKEAYNAHPLGTTGKGQTVVFMEGLANDGYDSDDLDAYVKKYPELGPFHMLDPIYAKPGKKVGKKIEGETEMDLEVVHAIAPDAQLVTVDLDNAPGNDFIEALANAFSDIDKRFPGSIVSMSLGFPCDRLLTDVDTQPLEKVLRTAASHGMAIFQSSGDSGGFECKFFNSQLKGSEGSWWGPPTDEDKGVDPVAALPEVTDVGGTTLSTDKKGTWVAEAGWIDVPLQQGTGGGPSALYARPDFQKDVASPVDATHRLTPDVSADADPSTGMDVYIDGEFSHGGGTSQSAPIWAALTALMNEYLTTHGGQAIGGQMNKVLYEVAHSGARPAFHDVILGGNAVYNAAVGYDVVTGLGTPDTDALVHDILDAERSGR